MSHSDAATYQAVSGGRSSRSTSTRRPDHSFGLRGRILGKVLYKRLPLRLGDGLRIAAIAELRPKGRPSLLLHGQERRGEGRQVEHVDLVVDTGREEAVAIWTKCVRQRPTLRLSQAA